MLIPLGLTDWKKLKMVWLEIEKDVMPIKVLILAI
jgi:hypothetical protein